MPRSTTPGRPRTAKLSGPGYALAAFLDGEWPSRVSGTNIEVALRKLAVWIEFDPEAFILVALHRGSPPVTLYRAERFIGEAPMNAGA